MRETAPASAAASNSLSHLGSFTHTFPTGMERLQPARRANGEHTRFHAAHMAANLRRIFSTFVWIITLVSSSRTRIYPPNEGECGGWNRPSCATRSPYSVFFSPFRSGAAWRRRGLRWVRVRGWLKRAGRNVHETARKVGFCGEIFTVGICGGVVHPPPLSPLKEFTCRFSHAAVTEISKFLDISNNSLV